METIEQIKVDEGGYKSEIYLCTAGKLTWLYGRNITERPIEKVEWHQLSKLLKNGKTQQDWADWLFMNEVYEIRSYFINHGLYFDEIPEEVGNIIINMAYNMGVTKFNPVRWPKFFKAIKNKDWKQAAIEGRDSRWFNQVGHRSKRLMNALENI